MKRNTSKKSGNKSNSNIPNYAIDRLARYLLPMIQNYYESEEGQRELKEWKMKQKAKQTKP